MFSVNPISYQSTNTGNVKTKYECLKSNHYLSTNCLKNDSVSFKGSAPEYLWTIADLKKAAVGNLGPMDAIGKSYDTFLKEAKELALKHGIENPRMIIDIVLKEASCFGAKEQPYPISREEWEIFKSDAKTMAEYMPNVHVVDGTKYTAPI